LSFVVTVDLDPGLSYTSW